MIRLYDDDVFRPIPGRWYRVLRNCGELKAAEIVQFSITAVSTYDDAIRYVFDTLKKKRRSIDLTFDDPDPNWIEILEELREPPKTLE